MFESEDFDLDEDFLKDIGEKEQEYYSQKAENSAEFNPQSTSPSIECDFSSDITFDDEPDFARIPTRLSNEETAASENLAKSDGIRSDIVENQAEEKENRRNERNDGDAEKSRRTLALEILKKGKSDEEKGRNRKICASRFNAPTSGESQTAQSSNEEETRRRSLLEIFKKPLTSKSKTSLKAGQKVSPRCPARERFAAAGRVPLVRKFPGPAGLLPDGPTESSFEHGNSSSRGEDREVEPTEEDEDSGVSEYFSQDTERLFSGGAWRLMLDDLPRDFLRGHEISTIKRTARRNSRLKFLAGVVQRIDHSLDNPRVVFKDCTDSIEGTIHRDIPLAYPNVLEPGVVVLVRNAGLLAFQASPNFPTLEFHVMIAPRNILAVYSEKARLVSSRWMESVRKSSEEWSEIDDVEEAVKDVDGFSKSAKERESDLSDVVAEVNEVENVAVEIHRVDVPSASGTTDNVSTEGGRREVDVVESFGDDLLDSDNDVDTEDEILSQLDVDSIVTNYDSSAMNARSTR